jgi:hypothetical protein|tara:strand:- start:1098 stop:1766 length:669 start_codon:yes stop_codon:yes gene_type:complete
MVKDYIKESMLKSTQGHKIYDKLIMVINPLAENIDLNFVCKELERLMPRHLLKLIDIIYIGNFSFFEDRQINAIYKDGAIYLTNNQDSNEDIIDDIVHETSHSLEENYVNEIYYDNFLKQEFLGKRTRLKSLLNFHGYEVEKYNFEDVEYSQSLDEFFFETVGYSILNALSEGLFASAYAATSLREYFANGFEEYLLGDIKYLNTVSPKLYQKINYLYNMES